MDPKFQTSFIPRKSAVDSSLPSHTTVGIFTLVSIAIFVLAVLLGGSLFFWKVTLSRGNDALKDSLETYKNKLDGNTIKELTDLNNKIKIGSTLLDNHLAVSHLFDAINSVTLQNVRWKSFSYELNDQTGPVLIMGGEARGFADVALQSDAIQTDKRFINPLFSDVSLGQNNTVNFSLKSGIARGLISYKDGIKAKNSVVIPSSDTPAAELTPTPTSTNQ